MILSVGLVASAVVFGKFHYDSRAGRDTIRVTGASTRPFTSDVAKWNVRFRAPSPTGDMRPGLEAVQASVAGFLNVLKDRGIEETAVSREPVTSHPRYDRDGREVGLEVQQAVVLITDRLAVIEDLARDPTALLDAGVEPGGSNVEYFYSGIDSLKHDLLAGASEDARRRATEIVKNTGRGVGKLLEARAGVFQITEPFSTEVSGYGMYSTSTREKEITVTVHATFALE